VIVAGVDISGGWGRGRATGSMMLESAAGYDLSDSFGETGSACASLADP